MNEINQTAANNVKPLQKEIQEYFFQLSIICDERHELKCQRRPLVKGYENDTCSFWNCPHT